MVGTITVKKEGIFELHTCSCETPCVEADEGGYHCIKLPEHGLNGCGAVLLKGDL